MQEEVGMQGILTAEPLRPAPNGPTKGKLLEGPRVCQDKGAMWSLMGLKPVGALAGSWANRVAAGWVWGPALPVDPPPGFDSTFYS